jgi:hypothetical protein
MATGETMANLRNDEQIVREFEQGNPITRFMMGGETRYQAALKERDELRRRLTHTGNVGFDTPQPDSPALLAGLIEQDTSQFARLNNVPVAGMPGISSISTCNH